MSIVRIRFPLYSKILGWLLLNVVLVFGILYAFADRDQSGLNLLLTTSVRDRIDSIVRTVGDQLYDVTEEERAAILRRANEEYGVRFSVNERSQRPRPGDRANNSPPSDRGDDPPPRDRRGPESGVEPPPHEEDPPRREPHREDNPRRMGPRNVDIDVQRSKSETGYDVVVDLEIAQRGQRPRPIRMVVHTQSLPALFKFLGIERAVVLIAAILVGSALFWLPFVRHITQAIRELLTATQKMAAGKLETRVPTGRQDEIGHLAEAINIMGERLDTYLQGQRQFMADVAHEVISPVARIQIGLGILESRASSHDRETLNDIREDLDEMARMLNELLLFSRSGVESEHAPTVNVQLRKLISDVVSIETGPLTVTSEVPPELCAKGYRTMMQRAIANLVRNAQRHAANSNWPIDVSAWESGENVHVLVRDRGPGVSESELERLGEPFFRTESTRSQTASGFGLGLAIVRRCIAACGGEVHFRNRAGGGFEAEILLQRAT